MSDDATAACRTRRSCRRRRRPTTSRRSRSRRKMWLGQRAGGIVVPLLTAVVAFLIGGIVVAATGHNPLSTYRDIFNGAGLNWFFHPTTDTVDTSAYNLSQTLLQTTTLDPDRPRGRVRVPLRHVQHRRPGPVLRRPRTSRSGSARRSRAWRRCRTSCSAIVAATLAGAIWAGIAGFLKATVGAHEVITTIMLNWIAIWVGHVPRRLGRPAPEQRERVAADLEGHRRLARSCRCSGATRTSRALHVGFFVALAALVVFWLLLNRTTLGYEVRAVGFNPEAAHYGGISVRKNLIRAMAISGAFAGLAGGLDMLGYLYRFGVSDIPVSAVGFLGIAVALLGRNTAVGVGLARAAVRRAALRHEPRPAVERDRPGAREQPHLHDPGADRALRRRRRAHPLRLEQARKRRRRAAAERATTTVAA